MNTPAFYPFTLRSKERGHGTWLPPLARAIWGRIRPPNLRWYAVDAKVTKKQIELIVFDIENSVYGGIGAEVGRFTVKRSKLTPEEMQLLREAELAHAWRLAAEEYERRQQLAVEKEIAKVRDELFKEVLS